MTEVSALPLQLVWPSREHLPSYVAALERGRSPNNLRPKQQVIRANGGVLVEEFVKLPGLGGTPELRFRIDVRGLDAR